MNLLEDEAFDFVGWLQQQDFYLWNWLWCLLAIIVVIAIIVIICVACSIHRKTKKGEYIKVNPDGTSVKDGKKSKEEKKAKKAGSSAPAARLSATPATRPASSPAATTAPAASPALTPLNAAPVSASAPAPAAASFAAPAAPAPAAPAPAARRNPDIAPGMALIRVEAPAGMKAEGDTFTIRANEPFNIHDIMYTLEPGFSFIKWEVKSDGASPVVGEGGIIVPEDDTTYTFTADLEFTPVREEPVADAVICIPSIKGLSFSEPAQQKVSGGAEVNTNGIVITQDAGYAFMGWTLYGPDGKEEIDADGKFIAKPGTTYRLVAEVGPTAMPEEPAPAPAPAPVAAPAPAAPAEPAPAPAPQQIRIALEKVDGITFDAGDAIYVNPGEKINVQDIKYTLDGGCQLANWTVKASSGRPNVDNTGCFVAEEGKTYTIIPAVSRPTGTVITDNGGTEIADKTKDIIISIDNCVGISITDPTIITSHGKRVSTADIDYTAQTGYKLTGWTLYAGARVRSLAPDASFTVVTGKEYRLVPVAKAPAAPGEAGVSVAQVPGIRILDTDETVNLGGMFHISSISYSLDRKFVLNGWNLYVNGKQQGGLLTSVNSFKVQPGVAYKLIPDVTREAPAPVTETAPAAAPAATEPKEEIKMADPKEEEVVEEPTTEAEEEAVVASKPATKVYHVSKRKADGKWQVKFANGQKAIKLFDRQADAIEYAKQLAVNQEGRIVIHKEDGSFRKLTYKQK